MLWCIVISRHPIITAGRPSHTCDTSPSQSQKSFKKFHKSRKKFNVMKKNSNVYKTHCMSKACTFTLLSMSKAKRKLQASPLHSSWSVYLAFARLVSWQFVTNLDEKIESAFPTCRQSKVSKKVTAALTFSEQVWNCILHFADTIHTIVLWTKQSLPKRTDPRQKAR